MDQIPLDLLVSEDAVRAGVSAMEHIHGRHLGDMDAQEQEQARGHWRAQVEQVLAAVHQTLTGGQAAGGGGRAVIVFTDAGGEEIEIGVAFTPELHELSEDEVEGTPAQLLALSLLESLQDAEEGV